MWQVWGPEREPRLWLGVVLWLVAGVVVRAVLSAMVPLLPDETYYWDWSRRLAVGYFDHPPGIAFLVAVGTALMGPTQAGVRAGPALAALLTHLAAVICAHNLGIRNGSGAQAALRAAAVLTVMPIATLGLVLATPDALLFMAAMLALLAVERALVAEPGSRSSLFWWCLTGLGLGLAFVAKYTAVLLPVGLVIAFLVHPVLRPRFKEPGPWVASLLALLVFAPVVIWNAGHDWVSFRFQLDHGFTPSVRGSPLSRELEMIGAQVGLASPILFVLMAGTVIDAIARGWRERSQEPTRDYAAQQFAIALTALVPLLFFAVSAWRRSVEANWPAMIYPGAVVLLASNRAPWSSGKWYRRGLGLGALLIAVVALQAWKPLLPLAPARDPIARAYGWDQLALSTAQAMDDAFLEETSRRWVAADRYQDASELAFHLPGQPQVFSLNLGGRANQYDLWPQIADSLQDTDGLVAVFTADAKGDSLAATVASWFLNSKQGPDVVLQRDGGEITRRRLWLYSGARDF